MDRNIFFLNVRRVADAQSHKQRWRKELHVLGGEQSHSLPILEPRLSAHWSPGSHWNNVKPKRY